jgi:hypothetical protein
MNQSLKDLDRVAGEVVFVTIATMAAVSKSRDLWAL